MQASEHLVIITGHSSGLGRALLDHCLSERTHVLGIARQRIDLLHPQLQQIQADLSAPDFAIEEALQGLAAFLAASWQSVTLVNNAGTIGPVGMVGQLDARMMASSLRLNLTVPIQFCNWLLGCFPTQTLRLVQISSGAARKPYAGWAAYCSSKAGLRMASQVMATEAQISGRDLRIVVYEPGVLDTPMQEELRRAKAEDFPEVDRFRQLKNSGQLVAPHDSARELWQILCSKGLPAYTETRYGTRS